MDQIKQAVEAIDKTAQETGWREFLKKRAIEEGEFGGAGELQEAISVIEETYYSRAREDTGEFIDEHLDMVVELHPEVLYAEAREAWYGGESGDSIRDSWIELKNEEKE